MAPPPSSLRVAVTGANGFVGRALLADLERAGLPAIALARRPLSGTGAAAEWRRSPDLDPDTDPGAWARAFAGADAVVHAAARVHVMRERAADPLAAFRRVNRDGAAAMARGAAMAGVRRIVLLSTVKVMGESTTGRAPFRNDDPPAPEDPYAISKLEGEDALARLAGDLGFDLVVLRPPLVYGPGVGGNMATLARLVGRGTWLPLGRASHNRRSMISTANLSSAIIAALTAPAAAGRRLLVSDGADLSTAELLRELAAAMGRPARLVPVPGAVLRPLLRATGRTALWTRLFGDLAVDIADTCARLGWRPAVSVAEGMAAMVGTPAPGAAELRHA